MENTIIENVSLKEIINGINTGLYQYNDINNIRIINIGKPDYIILPVEADISESILSFMDSDLESTKYGNSQIELDTTVLDFVVISKDVSKPGKYIITAMAVLELMIANSELDSENKWNFDSETFKCFEINYIEQESELPTDMNILG